MGQPTLMGISQPKVFLELWQIDLYLYLSGYFTFWLVTLQCINSQILHKHKELKKQAARRFQREFSNLLFRITSY